jgi:hypothetical protein
MAITSHMHITRGMDITGLFVERGGKGAGWSPVTTRIIGRLDIISIDRPLMATGKRKFCASSGHTPKWPNTVFGSGQRVFVYAPVLTDGAEQRQLQGFAIDV